MQPGIDTTNPFSADAQVPESVGSGEVGAPPEILLQPVMAGTGMVEKKPMNWSHFGIGIGITFGYFVIYWFLIAVVGVLGGSLDVIWFSCNPCFVMPVVAIAASVKGMPHIATGIGAVFMAGVVLFLGVCALILMGSGMMLEG